MATRAQLRTWLRRRLQEATPAQWTEAALNDYLNEGLRNVQQHIEKVDPEAFIYIDAADTVASEDLYPFPVNMKSIVLLEYKTSSGAEYAKLPQRTRRQVRADLASNRTSASPSYALQGRYFKIAPAPTAAVTDGIQLTYVPALAMGSDSDVPELPVDLHLGIVLSAQLIALGDTAEATDKRAVREELAAVLLSIPIHYRVSNDDAELLAVDSDVKFYADGRQ
jgi:hypothetical protein